jgi:hypothetical protein
MSMAGDSLDDTAIVAQPESGGARAERLQKTGKDAAGR